jgi:hypothetical protein
VSCGRIEQLRNTEYGDSLCESEEREPHTEDLRQLMMVERLKTIRSSIVVRRETTLGSLRVSTRAEEPGKEFKTQVHISSFDMKRVFDPHASTTADPAE